MRSNESNFIFRNETNGTESFAYLVNRSAVFCEKIRFITILKKSGAGLAQAV
jgi:hypothetical protein